MAHATKPKRFRLSFVGPIEDQPRLIRAYGRACDGEFALVIRPSEARAVLVLITKKDGAFMWRSDARADDGLIHARATVLRDGRTKLRIETGEHAGVSFLSYEDLSATVGHGDLVDVAFAPDDQFAHVVGSGAGGDAPMRPETPIDPKDAVTLIKTEQKAVPKEGPTTLRGRWTGYLYCDDGTPRVELTRRLATYGTLTVSSHMGAGWSWSFERGDKWFSDEGVSAGEGFSTLSAAIEAGVLGAMSLVREACSFRDTRRRAAHDPVYATKHPIRTPKPMKNPTDRLKVRDGSGRRRKAAPPKPLDEGEAVEVPSTAAELNRMAEVATTEGDALAALSGRQWSWEETTPPAEIAEWFDDNGFQGLGESIVDYAKTTTYPVGEFIEALTKDLRVCETVHDDDPDPKVYAEAQRQIGLLRLSLTSTPAAMERARKLIRYAAAMTRSPLCRGKEQKEAAEAVRRAAKAYEDARDKILHGQSWDALTTLRRIGERVSLSAAKAARSCASGQTSLTAASDDYDRMPKKRTESAYNYAQRLLSEATSRVCEGHHQVAGELLEQAGKAAAGLSSSKATRLHERITYIEGKLTEALTPDGWQPFAEGDRVVFKDLHGMVSRIPPREYGPTDKVTFLADGRRRGRRLEARLLVREDEVATPPVVTAPGPADAEKDKVLIDAFSAAIAAALGEEAA